MADESAEPQQRENGSAAEDRPMLAIGAQYIKDLSFENPLGPEGLAKLTENPKVEVEVNTSARLLAESAYEVSLFIRAEAQSGDATACGIRWRHPGGDVLQVVRRYDEGGQLLPLETTWP